MLAASSIDVLEKGRRLSSPSTTPKTATINTHPNTYLGAHLHPGVHVVLDEASQRLAVRGDQVLLVGEGQQLRLRLGHLVLGATKPQKTRGKKSLRPSVFAHTGRNHGRQRPRKTM